MNHIIKIKGLDVMPHDLPFLMDWTEAVKSASEIRYAGRCGWRLPSLDELKLIFQFKDTIGGFRNTYYWSSSDSVKSGLYAFVALPSPERQGVLMSCFKSNGYKNRVRLVRRMQ